MADDGLPAPVREYVFARGNRWRADFAWVKERILVEVEGGVWNGGRHVTGSGFTRDCLKYDTAALLGWIVLRFTPELIYDGTALKMIHQAFDRI